MSRFKYDFTSKKIQHHSSTPLTDIKCVYYGHFFIAGYSIPGALQAESIKKQFGLRIFTTVSLVTLVALTFSLAHLPSVLCFRIGMGKLIRMRCSNQRQNSSEHIALLHFPQPRKKALTNARFPLSLGFFLNRQLIFTFFSFSVLIEEVAAAFGVAAELSPLAKKGQPLFRVFLTNIRRSPGLTSTVYNTLGLGSFSKSSSSSKD